MTEIVTAVARWSAVCWAGSKGTLPTPLTSAQYHTSAWTSPKTLKEGSQVAQSALAQGSSGSWVMLGLEGEGAWAATMVGVSSFPAYLLTCSRACGVLPVGRRRARRAYCCSSI